MADPCLISFGTWLEKLATAMTSASVAPTLPLANLKTRDLTEVCRWLTTAPDITIDFGKPVAISIVALQNHSGRRTAQWRVTGARGATTVPVESDGAAFADEDGVLLLDEAGNELLDEQPVSETGEALDIIADSGWMHMWPRVATWGSRAWGDFPWDGREVVAGANDAIWLPDAALFVRYLRIQVDDPDADGFHQVGRLLVDAAWRPTVSAGVGASVLPSRGDDVVYETHGGQSRVDRRPSRRTVRFRLGPLAPDEALPRAIDPFVASGKAVPLFVMLLPAGTAHRHRLSIYGLPGEIHAVENANPYWLTEFTVVEERR